MFSNGPIQMNLTRTKEDNQEGNKIKHMIHPNLRSREEQRRKYVRNLEAAIHKPKRALTFSRLYKNWKRSVRIL
jgi:hypothetical protein